VANTLVLLTIPYKHLASSVGPPGLSSVDWNLVAERYLDAYRAQRTLNETHLGYYRARRCIYALIQGQEGQEVWRHPAILSDLIEHVHTATGIRVAVPG
jgi:hypothetical protein